MYKPAQIPCETELLVCHLKSPHHSKDSSGHRAAIDSSANVSVFKSSFNFLPLLLVPVEES